MARKEVEWCPVSLVELKGEGFYGHIWHSKVELMWFAEFLSQRHQIDGQIKCKNEISIRRALEGVAKSLGFRVKATERAKDEGGPRARL